MDAAIVAWEHHPHWDVGGSFGGAGQVAELLQELESRRLQKKKWG